jgi:hypothetical protein
MGSSWGAWGPPGVLLPCDSLAASWRLPPARRAWTPPTRVMCTPLGAPAAELKATTNKQRPVVISVRSASLFSQNGPGARDGRAFPKRLCFSCFSKYTPPVGPLRRLFKATTNNAAFRHVSRSVGVLVGQNGHGARDGAHFQDVCVSHFFFKSTLPSCFAFPWGFVTVSGPPPRGRPLGLPWPILRPRRATQPTVMISVRRASLFGQSGPDAREGCPFSK